MQTFVINAAGGNPTAIRTIKSKMSRSEYENYGKVLMEETAKFGVEQAGFLVHEQNGSQAHFEMSGSEFCGNAARSAAVIISLLENKPDNTFTMSGFRGKVSSYVEKMENGNFFVKCEFPDLTVKQEKKNLNGKILKVVDLGGIVHVAINSPFPKNYQAEHEQITKELGLRERDAVGVLWLNETPEGNIKMEPVVWVKSINTFFHETSCGSGTIAAACVTGKKNIIQPSGEMIEADITEKEVILSSEMQILFQEESKIDYIFLNSVSDKEKYLDGFIKLYKEAFGGPPYSEVYSDEWIKKEVWDTHLKNGCVFIVLYAGNVVGLSCAIPVAEDKKVFSFLSQQDSLPFDLKKTLYMSELAVASSFRKSDYHFGSELARKRIYWGKENGFQWYIMRTAAENSNSKNLYVDTLKAQMLENVIQDVSENPNEVASASNERIFLYGDI